MINNSDDFTRRILKYPAIRSCESVNPATLLSSLINHTHTICNYKSFFFSSNKRNSKESIRLIGNLLLFFEEIRNRQSKLSDSVVMSLSELHFIFQKVEFLLEDCARDDAQLWMLMKSEQVSNQLRILIRAIGVALDVLQLDSIDVSIEVKELVELVKRQALRAKIELEKDDKRASNKVLSIVSCFEDGIVPDSSDLKWVLGYLGIQSWSQCNQEIKFLDAEIGLESLTNEKKDLGLLSSLMGLMTYFRCVHFNFVDTCIATRQSDTYGSSEVISCLNSDDFRCPISLEFMLDPVTIATGHTYDRSSIQKWFKAGNPICPKTGEKLICTNLVPNLAMKQLIKQYCLETGIPFAETGMKIRDRKTKPVVAGSVAAEGGMKMLANFLVGWLVSGTGEEQNKAAYEIRLLTKTSIFNRSCLVEAGVIPNLLNLLCSKDSARQENAMAAILNLSKYSESKRILVENGGLELVLDVLQKGLKMEARQHAAGTLFYLASVEEYRIMIGEIPWAISALMELIVEGTDRAKKNALVTIFGLLMYPDNHWRVLSAGVVPVLVNLLGSLQREDLMTDCLAVLAILAEKLDGAMAILRSKALHIIVEVFGYSTTRPVKEYCVSLLLALCTNGGADVVLVLVKNPSLMGPLYSLLADGSCRASRKASSLIRILHEFSEKSSSGLMTPALPRERFIHVR